MHTENLEIRKSGRISIRLDQNVKQKIEKAAALVHRSLTSFVLASLTESADKILKNSNRMVLDDKDWDAFYNTLNNPPKPNKALKKAWTDYKKMNIKSEV